MNLNNANLWKRHSELPNLNAFRRRSGNLEHCGGLPLAGLKVRGRISKSKADEAAQAAAHEVRGKTHEPHI